jgi:hypothetical protein
LRRLHGSYLGIPIDQAKEARKYLTTQLALHRRANEGAIERLRIGDTPAPSRAAPAAAGASPGQSEKEKKEKKKEKAKPPANASKKRSSDESVDLTGEDSILNDWNVEEELPIGGAMAPAPQARPALPRSTGATGPSVTSKAHK